MLRKRAWRGDVQKSARMLRKSLAWRRWCARMLRKRARQCVSRRVLACYEKALTAHLHRHLHHLHAPVDLEPSQIFYTLLCDFAVDRGGHTGSRRAILIRSGIFANVLRASVELAGADTGSRRAVDRGGHGQSEGSRPGRTRDGRVPGGGRACWRCVMHFEMTEATVARRCVMCDGHAST